MVMFIMFQFFIFLVCFGHVPQTREVSFAFLLSSHVPCRIPGGSFSLSRLISLMEAWKKHINVGICGEKTVPNSFK